MENVPGIAQKASDTCTSAATAVLCARRLIVDNKTNETFTYENIRESVSNSFRTGRAMSNGKTQYTLKFEELKEYKSSPKSMMDKIASLLDEHKEGIVFYFTYGNSGRHAIVISDYTQNPDGTYQFFAYDSSSTKELGRKKLEDTFRFRSSFGKGKSLNEKYENFFAHAIAKPSFGSRHYCVWYINGEK